MKQKLSRMFVSESGVPFRARRSGRGSDGLLEITFDNANELITLQARFDAALHYVERLYIFSSIVSISGGPEDLQFLAKQNQRTWSVEPSNDDEGRALREFQFRKIWPGYFATKKFDLEERFSVVGNQRRATMLFLLSQLDQSIKEKEKWVYDAGRFGSAEYGLGSSSLEPGEDRIPTYDELRNIAEAFAAGRFHLYLSQLLEIEEHRHTASPSQEIHIDDEVPMVKFPGTNRAAFLARIYLNEHPNDFAKRFSISVQNFIRENKHLMDPSNRCRSFTKPEQAKRMNRDFIMALAFIAENGNDTQLTKATTEYETFLRENQQHFH